MAFRSSSIISGADGVDAAVPVPAGVAAGDIVEVFLYKEDTGAVTPPAGFTQKAAVTSGNASQVYGFYLFWKRLTAADTGTYVFTWTATVWREAIAVAHSGRVATGDPYDGTQSGGTNDVATAFSTTNVTVLNVSATPANSGGDAVGAWTNFNGGINWTPPANYTERQDGDVSCVDTRDSITAGSTGNVTATASSSRTMKAILGVLAAPGPATVTGAIAGTLPGITGSLTGAIPQDVTGAISGALPAVTGALTGTSDALPAPFVTSVSGLHFVDQDGQPTLIRGDTVWALPVNAGRWNGGDWAADIDAYTAARAAHGFNVLYLALLGSTQNNGPADTGATFDGVLPFVGGDPGVLNEAYWQRVDYILASAEAQGITVFCDFAYSSDLNDAALSGKTNAQFTGYGTALGTRYADRPNLVWTIGGDYFDDHDTQLTNVLTALRAAGDTHLIAAENYSESTSRFDLSSNSVRQWGTDHAQFNFVYTYNVTYFGVEYGYDEASPLPVLWGDGHYDQRTTADRHLMRNLTWWAYTSGSRGAIYGAESIWNWSSGSLALVTSPPVFAGTDLPTIRDTFASYDGWHDLLPDTDSSFVTAGRGTRAVSLPSGGGGAEYNSTSPQDPYVTASVTPDGTLAMAYLPVATTITVDDGELVPGYTVAWVDPVTGAATPTTPAATYTSPGGNSVGDADWLLVFQAPTGVTGAVDGTLPALTGAATGAVSVNGATAGELPAVTGSMAGALSVAGAVAVTLPTVTGTLTGGLGVTGAIDGDLDHVTGALQAESTAAGSLAGTLPGVTGGLAGAVGSDVTGALTGTLPALTGGLAGAATAEGAVAGALPGLAGALTGFVGVEAPPVDFTATIAPARVRGRTTVAASHTGWTTGDTRAGSTAADTRSREPATVTATHEIPTYAAAGSRQDWQADDNRTGIQVGPSRDDRKE